LDIAEWLFTLSEAEYLRWRRGVHPCWSIFLGLTGIEPVLLGRPRPG